MPRLTQMTLKLTVLAGLVGSGAVTATPAFANNHLNSSDSSTPMQQAQMEQPDESPMQQQPTQQQPMQQPMQQQPMQQPMQQQPQMGQPDSAMTNSVVDVAANNESFSTLTQAVEAAGLTTTLSAEGPYTVFAPTDEAFNQLPDGVLDYLLQPENKDLLRQVLTYHVVPAEVMSSEIATGAVEAIGGGLAVRVMDDGGVIVNNASVINPDIQASNGVVHAVNRVLLPETVQQALADRLDVQNIY